MKPLRVGIIGTGRISGSHITGYLATEGIELYGVCDVVEERAVAASEKHSIAHVFKNFEALVNCPEIDLVSVCTPPFAHKDPTIAALEAGKHVLCEKPMALTAMEAEAMVDAWEHARVRHGNLFTIGYQGRWTRSAQLLKKFIDAGELGDIYYGRALATRRRGLPGWGVFTDKRLNGGGPVIDIGVHALDRALWLMGHPDPVSVMAVTFNKFGNRPGMFNPWGPWDHKGFDVEDAAFALIRFANGACLQLECSWILNIERSISKTILCGTEGGAEIDPLKIYQERHGTILDVIVPQGVTEGQDAPADRPHTVEIRGFVKAIREGTDPLVHPREALMVARIVDAIYESDREGRSIQLQGA